MVRIIQNYTLYEIIGEGAYGKVYRAINKNDGKEYAVKVIQVRRFKENKKLEECTVNQINILTNIEKNQHIIKYIDMLKTPNNFYFVYEFCNGGTLEGVLRKERVIQQKRALQFFKQLIDAFQVLNKYNIMHRDLKPDNIFFNNGVVKLGDFGFCKSLEKANMTKTMLGSPIYMAPQILRGQIYSTKADIWSLGVVLYEMLYGFCPFESTTIPKLIEVLKETELEFPSKQAVTDQTKKLLRKLLTKDPTKRMQWMQVLAINISPQGKLLSGKHQRLSLVEDQGDQFKITESKSSIKEFDTEKVSDKGNDKGSVGYTPYKKGATEVTSNASSSQSYSPPTTDYLQHHSHSETNLNAQQATQNGNSFLKKQKSYEVPGNVTNPRRNSTQNDQVPKSDQIPKKLILKEHAQSTRGLHLAVQLIKSGDSNCVLFAYLILKKAQQKLITIRDQIASNSQYKELLLCFNSQLKEISLQVSKYNMTQSITNWKGLVKATGEFHRNFRAFYMMVVYLAGEVPREDLSHVEMQMEVRNKLY